MSLCLSVLLGIGCSSTTPPTAPQQEQSHSNATFSISVGDVETFLAPSDLQSRPLSALSFSYADVSRLLIDVKEKDSGNILFVNFDLFLSAGEWTGTLPFLPKAKALTFSARALDSSGSTLFSGTTDQTLSINNEKVIIALAPSNDGQTIALPRIKRISIPTAFGSDQGGNVSFSAEANTGEKLTYTIAPASGGGTFHPLTGSITLAATVGTFVSQYAPPSVSAETDIEHIVKVTNEAGHSITTTFKTKVKPPGKTHGVKDSVINVLFNPVINGLTASRVVGTGDVTFEAAVADDGALEELTYSWLFTPTGTFEPLPAFTGDTNPSTLQNYTTQVQGQVKLAVTDAKGGTTTLYYQLKPGQFPDNPFELGAIQDLRAGASHTCILFNRGTLRCWGANGYGQLGHGHTLGIGDDEPPSSAGDVPLMGVGSQLALGGNHTCALLDTGYVRCWGLNKYGQLGYNTTENVGDGEPIAGHGYVSLGGNAVKLATGHNHSCALMETGKVRCWGLNSSGQLGYGHKNNVGDNEQPWRAGDVDLGGAVRDLVAGAYHICAQLETGGVRCWGNNTWGQLGHGHTRHIGDDELPSSVSEVSVGGQVLQLSAGAFHTCALLTTNTLRCWGFNGSGQLGHGHTTDIGDNELPSSVSEVNVGGRVLQVAAGQDHTCALLSTGGIKCWGLGEYGQLGYGNTSQQNAPPSATVDLGGAIASQLTAGAHHTCAVLNPGKVRCWGLNNAGQLGYGHRNAIGDNELPASTGDISILTP